MRLAGIQSKKIHFSDNHLTMRHRIHQRLLWFTYSFESVLLNELSAWVESSFSESADLCIGRGVAAPSVDVEDEAIEKSLIVKSEGKLLHMHTHIYSLKASSCQHLFSMIR